MTEYIRQNKSTALQSRTALPGSSTAGNEKKPERIVTQRQRKINSRRKRAAYVAIVCAAFGLLLLIVGIITGGNSKATATDEQEASVPLPTTSATSETVCFVTQDGTVVEMQHMTAAWAAEAGFEKRYDLTDAERYEVAQVVTAEAGGEPYAGKIAVAQCILQAAEDDNIRPTAVLKVYGYTTNRPEPTQEALDAVGDVFDLGHVATRSPIKYFYNPNMATSSFHESQVYIMTINNHKFFKEAKQ